MLVRNAVMPPVRPRMPGKNATQVEAWLNDVGPLSQPLQPKAATHTKQEPVAGYASCVDYGPLEHLLKDESISEITCIGPRRTYVERNGLLEEVRCYFENEEQMLHVIEQMLLTVGQQLQPGWPIVDARLSNGMQLHAVLPPNAINGPILTLHKHVKDQLTLAELVDNGTLSQAMADVLQACVEGRLNIVICGSQHSGRTTLLNALCADIPEEERIITIEESSELRLQQKQVISLVVSAMGPHVARNVTLRHLMMSALHMGPERIILGECRGEEVIELFQALYTGYNGSLMTAFATNALDCLSRLETLCHADDTSLPAQITRQQITDSVDIIVHISRMPDGSRKVLDIAEVLGSDDDELKVQSIFRYSNMGLHREKGTLTGDFEPCGICPTFLSKLAIMDIYLSQEVFGAASKDDTVMLPHSIM